MVLLLSEVDWNSLLHEPDMLPIMLVTGFAGIIGLAAIIAPQWRKAQQAGNEARLKERMIERGFTADEIKTVINASAEGKRVAGVADPPHSMLDGGARQVTDLP